tara:strand:- start:1034 stop:2032 length:999 start_codon:yes stop_codon:yes gene_type:complete
MENIIVTGGLGFIGLNLLSYLTNKKKYFVHNIDNFSLGHTYFDDFLTKDQKLLIKNHKIDINQSDKVKKILEDYNINKIFHLAAESHVDRSISGPIEFYNSNVMGTLNLVETCRNFIIEKKILGFKFVHVSTDEVFGDLTKDDEPFNEKTPYNPSSPYSASKAASDFIIKSWFRTFQFPGIITNCSNNFGPCQNLEKFIPMSITKLLKKEKMGIYGNGQNIRDWLFVQDHVEALYLIMMNGNIGETYCIGGNTELTNIDLFKEIYLIIKNELNLNVLPYKDSFSFISDRLGHDFRYSINTKKIENKFGIKFKTNLKKSLNETVEFYIQNNLS